MTTQSAPAIPPRPSRSVQQQGLAPTSSMEAPKMPARPAKRIERSISPLRHNYAPSPLNEPPNSAGLSRTTSHEGPPRPPSVTIPSLGEEGIEYAGLDVNNLSDNHHQTPAESRNVDTELKIHAPRPSLPPSSAKAQLQAVTRTDSRQAAAAGLGVTNSPALDDHSDRASRSLHSGASGSRADSSTASSTRRQSFLEDEHGIPEFGRRVPMYRNAGDVQAPSPTPYHENGSRSGRTHQRTRSVREASLPPGSYGLHGHGVQPDKFDKAWYEKHPDEFVKEEQGQYGPGVGTPRPDWALSSDDLNKIVRGSAVTGSGLGTSPAVAGTPEEEVGYLASDEYTHRIASPSPSKSRRTSRPAFESPLRKASVPVAQETAAQEPAPKDEEPEYKAGVIHVDDPYHPMHHPDGFAPAPDPEEQAHAAEEGDAEEEEPILAADEVRPESAFQHAAVSPTFERRESFDHEGRSRTPSANHSRSNSRSTSQHGIPTLARFGSYAEERESSHTPLEDVEEYEPLFPENDKKQTKPVTAADRFKQRPELHKHRFPSQDIWEDSPNSLQLHATVSTPDEPKGDPFETPEQESFRRSQAASVDPHKVATHILESEDKRSSRPVSKQRFPSRDIWEDTPDSQQLVTKIEPSEDNEVKSPDVPSKPAIPARPPKLSQPAPTVNAATKPNISPTEKKQPPVIPDRPKPQIPARPAKPVSCSSAENTKEAAAKPKPAVPARPGGSKIAALKAGFLTDLNSRLQVGPQAPKPEKEEKPAEKGPLSDARKGRARGPARRKPAAEPAQPTPAAAKPPAIPEIKITQAWNVWEIHDDGNLIVGDEDKTEKKEPSQPATSPLADHAMAPEISKNVAGESTDPQPMPAYDLVSPGNASPPEEQQKPFFSDAPQKAESDEKADEKEFSEKTGEKADEKAPSPPPIVEVPDTKTENKPTSPESELDEAIEHLSASADGKRLPDGDVQPKE